MLFSGKSSGWRVWALELIPRTGGKYPTHTYHREYYKNKTRTPIHLHYAMDEGFARPYQNKPGFYQPSKFSVQYKKYQGKNTTNDTQGMQSLTPHQKLC